MDADLQSPSDSGIVNIGNGVEGGVSDETLISKYGEKGKEEAGGQREGVETKLNGDSSAIGVHGVGGGEIEVRDTARDGGEGDAGECAESIGVVEKEVETRVADDESIEDMDVDIDETVVIGKDGDGCEGDGDGVCVESSVEEKKVQDMIDKKWSGVVDDDMLEDVDVDIDDSGNLQAVVLAGYDNASVDVGGGEVGNDRGTVDDTACGVEMRKEDEMVVECVGASLREDKMEQDGAFGKPISGTSGTPPHPSEGEVGNLVGESEDEEVDIGGHEPNMFTNPGITTDANIRSEPVEKVLQISYKLPAWKEGVFSVSDMVWGKVRSHPWWPGQIFDASKASEIAMKHHKKDKGCYLVAFFGDRTFAWSETSQLRHFHAHFPHVEKQSNSESFHHAISCALEEVSRRVEVGLACRCIQTDVYENIRYQNVENTGIQEEASRIENADESAGAQLFEPRNFLRYLKSVAHNPFMVSDQLQIVIAKAQLLAFNRLKGYYHLPEYHFNELPLNNNSETVKDSSFAEEGHNQSDSLKRKQNMRDIVFTSKRERNIDESMLLMGEFGDDETYHSSSASQLSSKKQNNGGVPRQSFKIGDCIVRAASQLTGAPGPSSFLKSINEKYQKASESNEAPCDGHFDHENHSVYESTPVTDDVLSQPQSVAHDSTKELIVNIAGNTFLSPDKAGDGQNIKAPKSVKGAPEAFEFEDMKDSYWTDRVIQNGGEEKPERKINYQIVSLQPPSSLSRTPRVHSRKRYSNGSHKIVAEQPLSAIDKSKRDMLPAELILNFPDVNSIPSEGKLNNIFRRFGPLKEFETEVDRESSRARVVFKRAFDAEVAISSCEKFNIFGSTNVRYELSYTPSVSYKADRIPATQGMETVTLPEIDFASSGHDLGFITMQDLEDATMQDLQYQHHHDLDGVTMQDLEFTTNDLDFPGSQDLDIVSTHASELTSFQSMDISTEHHQHELQPASGMTSSENLELKTRENMIHDSGSTPQDMKIVTAENQQQVNQDPIIKTLEDSEPTGVQVTEAVTIQQVEEDMNPETAGDPTLVDTTEGGSLGNSAQGADNSRGQDTEVNVTEVGDAIIIGVEEFAKAHDSVSASLLKVKSSTDSCTNSDVTGLEETEVATDYPMISGDQNSEQGANLESGLILSHQSADQEKNQDGSMTIQESQVASTEDDRVVVEMLAPDVGMEHDPVEDEILAPDVGMKHDPAEDEILAPDVEMKQNHIEIDASESVVSVTHQEAPNEIMRRMSAEATETEVTAIGIQNTEDTEVTANVIQNTEDTTSEIKNSGDDASVFTEAPKVEMTEHDEKQVAQDIPKEAPDTELTPDDNVEIIEPQELEPQIEVSSVTGNVEALGNTCEQNDVADGVATEEADEKDLRKQDYEKTEQQVVDSTTAAEEVAHEAT